MKGRLNDPADLEWLLAWLKSGAGERVDIIQDPSLIGLEFEANAEGLKLAWYAFEIMRSGACRNLAAVPVDGWWCGLN